MLEGARPKRRATDRIESPPAMPREISSRSNKLRLRIDRLRSLGASPPLRRNTACNDHRGSDSEYAISLRVYPFFQRAQSSLRSGSVNTRRRLRIVTSDECFQSVALTG